MNFKMNQLNEYLIKDLTNIVKFYLSLRTIDFDDKIISYTNRKINCFTFGNISKLYFKFRTVFDADIYIGITNTNMYFCFSMSKNNQYIYRAESLNRILDVYLLHDEKEKFLKFQNENKKMNS
jgi:hypothetical protein